MVIRTSCTLVNSAWIIPTSIIGCQHELDSVERAGAKQLQSTKSERPELFEISFQPMPWRKIVQANPGRIAGHSIVLIAHPVAYSGRNAACPMMYTVFLLSCPAPLPNVRPSAPSLWSSILHVARLYARPLGLILLVLLFSNIQ
jgi:hypothetical protein